MDNKRFGVGVLILGLIITGCSVMLPSEPPATPAATAHAMRFASHPEKANLYIHLTTTNPMGVKFTHELKVNGQQQGRFNTGEFMNFQVAPGLVNLELHGVSEHGRMLNAKAQLRVEKGAVVTLACRYEANMSAILRPEGNVIHNSLEQCAPSALYRENGISACAKPLADRVISFSDDYDYDKLLSREHGGCVFAGDRSVFASAKLVTARVPFVTTDEYEYQKAFKQNTVAAINAAIKRYPNSRLAPEARQQIASLQQAEKKRAYEAKVRQELTRSSRLPPQVRQDKYTVLLTNHLKAEQYAQALFYFDVLERIGAPQSPLFEFFWGEALLRTGKPKDATEKFYGYLNATGTTGEYYTRALQLLSEAEDAL